MEEQVTGSPESPVIATQGARAGEEVNAAAQLPSLEIASGLKLYPEFE